LPPVSLTTVVHLDLRVANISANFRKNSKWSQCLYQGLGGRWYMKTWSKKYRDTVTIR
jgi:hypothetical protein